MDPSLANSPAPLSWAELFAEPPEVRSPHWFSAAYARLVALAGPRPPDLEHAPCHERARRASWGRPPDFPDPAAVGSTRPALVLVGEMAPRGQPAFRSRSGHWLLRALRSAGWDELEVLVTNACEPGTRNRGKRRTEVLRALGAWLTPAGASWVALGRVAGEVLRAAGVAASEAPHPQWHARFRTQDGPGGFAELLLAAGMPAGPWRGKQLPVVAHDDARTALADRFSMPRDVAFRRGRAEPAEQGIAIEGGGVRVSKREEARRLYVLGEAETVKAAAERVGCSHEDLQAIAREERWVEQRDRHAREATDQAIREARRSEAKAVAASRRLAWAATQLALGSVVKRLQSSELTPEIREAVALVSGARQLADLEVATGPTAERSRAELVAEAKRLLGELEEADETG